MTARVGERYSSAPEQTEHRDPHQRYLRERIEWLIRLRWIAIYGIFLAATINAGLGIVQSPGVLVATAFTMATYNIGCWLWCQQGDGDRAKDSLHRAIGAQILGDLVAVTVLLHWSGGAENPFAAFFVFHMTIGAMLLPLRSAVFLGIAASLLHGGAVLGELVGVLQHHPLVFSLAGSAERAEAGLWHVPYFVLGYLIAFNLTVFAVIYFVQSVAARQHRAELRSLERERVAMSRERLARVGEIAAGVAHTIRNPLHGVLNCVEILRSSDDIDPSSGETLSLMSEGLARIENVTQRLLVLTRDAPLDMNVTTIDGVIEDTLAFFAVRAARKKVQLSSDLRARAPVSIDVNRVGEALLNVLDNAVDACEPGATVQVRTADEIDVNSTVRIDIVDDGSGMDPQELPKIFDPFYTTKEIGKGSGLGLAITRWIVEKHGGSVLVESEPGRGTRVSLVLPADDGSGESA